MNTIDRINVSLTEAKYTKLYINTLPSTKTGIQAIFLNFNHDSDLYNMFLSMYRYYEICDEDDTVFISCISDKFNEYKAYYKELYDNYTKEYDYAVGNKKVVSRSDTSHSESDDNVVSSNASTDKQYDLPNKVVDPDEENGYLTGKDTHDGSSSVNNTTDHDSTYGSTITTEYKDEFLTLKRQYLNQIRNLYHEFCEKFKECFIQIY